MATVKDVYAAVDQIAPFAAQMDFDNAGFLVGRGEQQVTRLLVSLDITEEVVWEAVERGVELIVSHHPIIFHPARSITDETSVGRIVLALAERGIAAICAHTNLDASVGGVSDALADDGVHRVGTVRHRPRGGGDRGWSHRCAADWNRHGCGSLCRTGKKGAGGKWGTLCGRGASRLSGGRWRRCLRGYAVLGLQAEM